MKAAEMQMKSMVDAAAQDIATFEEPWHAQAFACIMELSKRGHFSWQEWVATFSNEITSHPQGDGETVNETYFRQWLSALETMILSRNLCTTEEIAAREDDWRRAYANTPHGQPIELSAASSVRCVPKPRQGDSGKPLVISPASS